MAAPLAAVALSLGDVGLSLPPLVRWEYGYAADAGSREALLTELFTKPQDWLGDASLEDRCRPHGAIN